MFSLTCMVSVSDQFRRDFEDWQPNLPASGYASSPAFLRISELNNLLVPHSLSLLVSIRETWVHSRIPTAPKGMVYKHPLRPS